MLYISLHFSKSIVIYQSIAIYQLIAATCLVDRCSPTLRRHQLLSLPTWLIVNAFILQLQGKDETITQLGSSLHAFKSKLQFQKSQVGRGNLKNFLNLQKTREESNCTYDTFYTKKCKSHGRTWCQEFS